MVLGAVLRVLNPALAVRGQWVNALLERDPANLRCSLPTSQALPIWGQAAGFYFSPILRLWRLNAMRRFGLAFSSPFPVGTARIKAQMPFRGLVNLALKLNIHVQHPLTTSSTTSQRLGSQLLGLQIFITSFCLCFQAAKHLWRSAFPCGDRAPHPAAMGLADTMPDG